jgi:hypothetical protein
LRYPASVRKIAANNPSRISDRHAEIGYIARNYSTGSDNYIATNGNAGQNDYSVTQPTATAN